MTIQHKDSSTQSNRKARVSSERPVAPFHGASTIYGLGYWLPEQRVTSAEIDARLANDRVTVGVEEATGVRERRFKDPDCTVIDMGEGAVRDLVRRGCFDGSPVNLDSIDLIIYCGVARHVVEPATAVFLQNRLGLRGVMSFDLSDACMGFSDAICVANAMIASGQIRTALVVAGEHGSVASELNLDVMNRVDNPMPYFAALTCGDGACAALIGPKGERQRGLELVAGCRRTYAEYVDYCVMESFQTPVTTKSGKLFASALRRFRTLFTPTLEASGWDREDIDVFICHQASLGSIRKGAQLVNVPFEKTFNTIEELGNIGSASVPITIARYLESRDEWRQEKLMIMAFGSGLGIGTFTFNVY